MKKYSVSGMNCAACVSRVEQATRKVDGVETVSVSLLTSSMTVEGNYDEETLFRAVERVGYGIGFEGEDFNEMGDPVTPDLSAVDGINPQDITFEQARSGGVTCVCTGPGSSNVIGGTFCAIKTWGNRVDDMILKEN